ncbi:major histocompatibility complex class I-related gene protein-like [Mugil cephalus]|uniref:major histocompatibility complex class I-related gene protein-like n=1 Tax=Mugil cephalus TaxID=48193 RepID=UPI001FB783D2|nr:major histocompatibility complex class I-related gene protein-like [Mugil cephalus]XP_047460623.1 major histocompatibility complex class I-related gene protein-like [Mugil cephalus]
MKELVVLLILFPIAHSVKNSLILYFPISSEVPDVPEYMVVAEIDGVILLYYDSSMKAPEPRQVWMAELIAEEPEQWEMISQQCLNYYHSLKRERDFFIQHSNQTGGLQMFQQIIGCEWDNETDVVDGYKKYGLNGEDFISFDANTLTWTSLNPLAETVKQELDRNEDINVYWKNLLTKVYLLYLKMFLSSWDRYLNRKDLPSVSLLQKTPSSPVSCHATGFYPDRAMMFWRKDGEEIHEGVEHGEILPNHDGSFQMKVDLNISSVSPEDWRRYDCVFQLSGVEDDVITKLDETQIRTNGGKNKNDKEKLSDVTIAIIATVGVLVLVLVIIAAVGFVVCRNNPVPERMTELTERLCRSASR